MKLTKNQIDWLLRMHSKKRQGNDTTTMDGRSIKCLLNLCELGLSYQIQGPGVLRPYFAIVEEGILELKNRRLIE